MPLQVRMSFYRYFWATCRYRASSSRRHAGAPVKELAMKSADDLQKILQEVCFEHSLEVRGTVEKYFSPLYRQLTDGHSSEREAFIQHISAVRQHIAVGRIRVDAFLISGNHFADRHHVSATKTDGSQVEIEI